MKHAWVIRLLVGSTLAVAAPILGIADVSAQVGTDDIFRITIAAATARTCATASRTSSSCGTDGCCWGGRSSTRATARTTARRGSSGAFGRRRAHVGGQVHARGERRQLQRDGGQFPAPKSGGIALFHLQKNVEVGGTQTPDCRVMLRTSRDEGRTFGPATQLTGEKRYVETASGRALRLKTGRILVECDGMETAFCLISDDDGATWREGQQVKPSGGGCWEPAAVERKDGRVLMFLRTGLGGQYQTISEDGGETWGRRLFRRFAAPRRRSPSSAFHRPATCSRSGTTTSAAPSAEPAQRSHLA